MTQDFKLIKTIIILSYVSEVSYFNKNFKKIYIGQMTMVGHNEKIKVKMTVVSTIIKK